MSGFPPSKRHKKGKQFRISEKVREAKSRGAMHTHSFPKSLKLAQVSGRLGSMDLSASKY